MKYGSVTLGQVEAAINNLGGKEVWDAWHRGEKVVIVKDAPPLLFDKNGRRIPKNLKVDVCDADRSFRLFDDHIMIDIRIMGLHESLSVNTGITAKQLRAETERLLALIRDNSQIANITKGVYLPVILPQLVTDDLGAELELYLAGVGNSYNKTFSNRIFYNYRKGTLENKVSVVDGSRHNQLIERMKHGPVIGISFPTALQGFSINAQREQIKTLPDGFHLSGIERAIEMIMYSDILARDYNTPGLDLAALSWQSANFSLGFKPNDDRLDFASTDFLTNADADYSGGLLFLG